MNSSIKIRKIFAHFFGSINQQNALSFAKSLATVSYLVGAFVITAATSKSTNDGSGTSLFNPFNGTTNYALQTDCSNQSRVYALRVVSGFITEVLHTNSEISRTPDFDFLQLGFPQSRVPVGLDQYGTDAKLNQNCIIKSKQFQINDAYAYDSNLKNFKFYRPGYLTTFQYVCTQQDAYSCSTILSELPAGDLSSFTRSLSKSLTN